jgi:hypothetical protein
MSRQIGLAAALALGLGAAALLGGAAGGQTPAKVGAPPLTLLQIMRANVEIPADGVWAVTSKDKLSDREWLLAEQDATNVIASASFIASAGIGPKDKGWQANANYQAWAKQVQDDGLKLLAAVKAKDLKALSDTGDHLAGVCQDCHDKYRPELPSDGIGRFPFYPPREMKKDG